MAKVEKFFKCEACGNIVFMLEDGGGELICCGSPMDQLEELTAEMKNEKHVPVVEKTDGGYKVTVGSTPHPMVDAHWIQWIELQTPTQSLFAFLNPGDEPCAVFKTDEEVVTVREYCNLHGLWVNREEL